MTANIYQASPVSFQLKGSLYMLASLRIQSGDLALLATQLTAKAKTAPNFFSNTPMVIDLSGMPASEDLDLAELVKLLRKYQIIPVGICGGNHHWQDLACKNGLAVLPKQRESAASKPEINVEPPNVAGEISAQTPNKLITEPVRSGQQIYAKGGDLIVLNSVSHGAELLADGNIHVYGELRGRVLAGINGDPQAHIFCTNLQAELISIAGQYRLSDNFKHEIWEQAVDIFLDNGNLKIRKL